MKQEFDFHIDEKVTIWNRLKFSVEAETLEEAKQKAIYMTSKNREDIDFYVCDFLYDTEQIMSVEDNLGNPTLELYSRSDDEILYDNGNDYNKVLTN
jgi:hypothetical protein